MGCHSSREKNLFQNIDSILQKYTQTAETPNLTLCSPTNANEAEENEYYQFASMVVNGALLDEKLLKQQRKSREDLKYPFYLIGWKFEGKIVSIGSAYTFKTVTEKNAVIKDILMDKTAIAEKGLDLLKIQTLLVKALTTIVFELEMVDNVQFDANPELFESLTKGKSEKKLLKAQYLELKRSDALLNYDPTPVELNILEKATGAVSTGIHTVGDGLSTGVSFVGSGVKTVGNGMITGVSAVGSGVVSAGKFVGEKAVKVGDAIIPGKKEEKKNNELKNDELHEEEKSKHEEKDKPAEHKEDQENTGEQHELKEVNVEIKHEVKEGMDIEKVEQN